jgi:hypothetical protein
MKKIDIFKAKLSTKDRIGLLVLGLVGLFTWSGLLIGPSLAIIVSLLPNRVFRKSDS